MEVEDKIIIRDFWDPGEHLYEHRLGWQPDGKAEGRSIVSKELFDSFVVQCGLNLAFYYVDNDTFYGLHRERCPIELKILPRDIGAFPTLIGNATATPMTMGRSSALSLTRATFGTGSRSMGKALRKSSNARSSSQSIEMATLVLCPARS